MKLRSCKTKIDVIAAIAKHLAHRGIYVNRVFQNAGTWYVRAGRATARLSDALKMEVLHEHE